MEKLFESFGLDWKIFFAQLINFFILFFIVYKFFSKPLNDILEKRKKEIEEGYKTRDEAEKLIKKIRELRRKILEKTEREKEKILSLAYQRKAILENEFQKEIEEAKKDFFEKFEKEKEEIRLSFHAELRKEIPKIFEKLAFKVFHDRKLNREFIEKILNE